MSILRKGNTLTLQNEFLRREIDLSDGICTKTYHIRPGGEKLADTWYPVFSFEESAPFETALIVNGESYEAGPFERTAGGDLWRRKGMFAVKDVVLGKGKFGDTAEIIMESRFDTMPNIRLHIEYEVCDDMPFLCKRIRVENVGDKPFTVDCLTVDILRFFGRTLPLATFTDYTATDDTRKFDSYYFGWTREEFPPDMELILNPNEEFASFDLFEAVTAVDRQDEAVILHRIYKRIAPWIDNLNLSLTVNSCNSMSELMECADSAEENGFELVNLHVGQLFTNTGDYIPRPDIFPNGYDDVKKIVKYFHQKGIKVLPYCSATIAWRDTKVCKEHEDWQCLGPNGLRYEPSGFGNMCYHSPWGEYIREKLFYLVDEIGFDGLALDGPVHGLVCQEASHLHRSEKSVDFMNWVWEKKFYGDVTAKGKIVTAPETWNALFLGVSERPGGYREEDQNELDGLPFVTMTRSCVYESRYSTPACYCWTAFNLELYHGHSIQASEENPASYEHALAGMIGYGFDGTLFAKNPYVGEKTKAIYFKWIEILKSYRDTLLGEFIHIAQPTGFYPDAVLHVSQTADIPGLAVIFNPTDKPCEFFATLPMRYAGDSLGGSVVIEGERIPLDSMGNALLHVSLSPYEVKAVPVYKAE